ncbi:MAG: LytTR family transcriptional regulator DNA-binding domain-containing protein [Flavobacteriaceae bacterium]|nr:LytTR family transcriptional regulator DNA-binding domain-containing protein [Flavobacteriaceae bacterium]
MNLKKYFEKVLKESEFARIYKSFLVNVAYISSYEKNKGGTVFLSNGKELSVLASKKATLYYFSLNRTLNPQEFPAIKAKLHAIVENA